MADCKFLWLGAGVRLLVAVGSTVGLLSCGGGGGGGTESTGTSPDASISGKVIDGYIGGATVFWDCNSNAILDASEISTVTTARGDYLIAKKPSDACNLVAEIGWHAVDSDNPSRVIGRPYTLTIAPGLYSLITPFTTMIAGKIRSGDATTIAQADAQLASELMVAGSSLIDYKAAKSESNGLLAATAKLAVLGLQKVGANLSFTEKIKTTYSELKAAVGTSGVREAQLLSIEPFQYNNSATLAVATRANGGLNANNLVQRARTDANAATNALLDNIASVLTAQHAADSGYINFQQIDEPTLHAWATQFSQLHVGEGDALRQAAIQKMRAALNQLGGQHCRGRVHWTCKAGSKLDHGYAGVQNWCLQFLWRSIEDERWDI